MLLMVRATNYSTVLGFTATLQDAPNEVLLHDIEGGPQVMIDIRSPPRRDDLARLDGRRILTIAGN